MAFPTKREKEFKRRIEKAVTILGDLSLLNLDEVSYAKLQEVLGVLLGKDSSGK